MNLLNTPEAWTERAHAAASSHKAAMWSETGQLERFVAVLQALDPQPGELLLDFGCGTGALSELVPDGVDYLGVDWSVGMFERARSEHPDRSFAMAVPPTRFDLVAVVGTFNLRHNWSEHETWEKIAWLWAHTDRALAASLYAGDDPSCIRYRLQDVIAFRRLFAPAGTVIMPRQNDLLLLMERE